VRSVSHRPRKPRVLENGRVMRAGSNGNCIRVLCPRFRRPNLQTSTPTFGEIPHMSRTGRRQFLQRLGVSAAVLSPLGSLAFGKTAQAGAQAGRGAAPPTGRGGGAPSFDLVSKGG